MSDAISRMRIEVPEEVLDDLRRRLAAARFPDQIPGSGWSYGTDGAYLRELFGYWRDKFDWRAQEARLNRFEQYHTNVDGQNVHFVHARSKVAGRAAARDHARLAGLGLRVPQDHRTARRSRSRTAASERDAFHVVCPSMPGLRLLGPDARARLGRAPRGRAVARS